MHLKEFEAAKKDLTIETTVIGPFTLRFATHELELGWQTRHLSRQRGISQRFLFMCAFYQLLFYLSDSYDSNVNRNVSAAVMTRISCSSLVLGACGLISTSTVQPSQSFLFVVIVAYGMMNLCLFLLQKNQLCQWDSLYLVYGLVFVMLPKISPLDFVVGLGVAIVYTVVFLSITFMQLCLGEWALSSFYPLIVLALFGYLSYTSERSSRERWLLRQRLQREHITLQLLHTSLRQDFDACNFIHLPLSLRRNKETSWKNISSVSTTGRPSKESSACAHTDATTKTSRKSLLARGLFVWAAFSVFAWVFNSNMMGIPQLVQSVDTSAAWALLMHTIGFSIFLLLLTRQVRWLVLNIFLAFGVLWLFSHVLPRRWMTFNINSFGYLLLLMVILVVLGVAGGVVYTWTVVVDFLKSLCIRYPEVHDDVLANKILEQVVIRQLAGLPRPEFLNSAGELCAPTLEEGQFLIHTSFNDTTAKQLTRSTKDYSCGETGSNTVFSQNASNHPIVKKKERMVERTQGTACPRLKPLKKVLLDGGSSRCLFCQDPNVTLYLPVCSGWQPLTKGMDGQEERLSAENDGKKLKMCVHFASLIQERIFLKNQVINLTQANEMVISELEETRKLLHGKSAQLQEIEKQQLQTAKLGWEALQNEKRKYEAQMQELQVFKLNEMARLLKQASKQLQKAKAECDNLRNHKPCICFQKNLEEGTDNNYDGNFKMECKNSPVECQRSVLLDSKNVPQSVSSNQQIALPSFIDNPTQQLRQLPMKHKIPFFESSTPDEIAQLCEDINYFDDTANVFCKDFKIRNGTEAKETTPHQLVIIQPKRFKYARQLEIKGLEESVKDSNVCGTFIA